MPELRKILSQSEVDEMLRAKQFRQWATTLEERAERYAVEEKEEKAGRPKRVNYPRDSRFST